MKNENSNRTTIGFTGLLTLIFITLKLCKVITWSWAWVLSPIWIPLGLTLVLIGILVIVRRH